MPRALVSICRIVESILFSSCFSVEDGDDVDEVVVGGFDSSRVVSSVPSASKNLVEVYPGSVMRPVA